MAGGSENELRPRLEGLSPGERQNLSRQWLADARLEHASIASFSRFVLDLLALGAPPELLARAQRAMGDEIEHARLCFALASVYGGTTLGPGPLDLRGVAPSASLAEAVAAALREGCINETLAALAASRQAERATDPLVCDVLARIAADEAEHAELAWRFVAWALESGDPAVSRVVAAVLAEPHPQTPPAEPRSPLAVHGRLAPRELSAVAAEAWREVIAPCLAALS